MEKLTVGDRSRREPIMKALRVVACGIAVVSLAACSSTSPGGIFGGSNSSAPVASAVAAAVTTSSSLASAPAVSTPEVTTTAPKTTHKAPSVHKFGATEEIQESGAVDKITVSAPKAVKPGEFEQVKGKLYGVTVTVSGVAGSLEVDPLFFAARDAGGDSFDADITYTDNALPTATVTAGQKLRGVLAFDVPKGKTISVVILSSVLGEQLATWS